MDNTESEKGLSPSNHVMEGGSDTSFDVLKTSKNGVVLVPQPTNDPKDPLVRSTSSIGLPPSPWLIHP